MTHPSHRRLENASIPGEEGAGLALGFMETPSRNTARTVLPPTCSRPASCPSQRDGHVVWGHTAPGFEPQLLTVMVINSNVLF